MTARKKWRLQLMTASGIRTEACESKVSAYRCVDEYRRRPGRIQRVNVQLSEDGGATWQIYERVYVSAGESR